ncbi:uncharacterized protein MKK02DRAFT_21589 [Dioszegia hungarica]|uniref:Centrosomin N-terminal motif 1 domain-containing protein n=1 Tax=Dioszegia hungarica TaxID=4972 RepID=A0AA38H0D1_9TREE|nr:uncharacterized protein MKK02DRAFT_21589 [Dioszegia hungarica]KAI9631943.1 hypothetical protein MKK02DRAFT_21589 [Dioszegia hungarica]
MPATSSLAALMQSPSTHTDSTILAHGRTLPDVSLDSLGSSFRSEDEERNVPVRLGVGGIRPQVSRLPTLPTIDSPDTSRLTPSPPPAAALLMSPPATVRRSSSSSVLERTPNTQAPRRSRIMRSQLTGSVSSASSSDAGRINKRYGDTDDESDAAGVLASLSINITPGKGKKGYAAGPSKRSGRHSVALEGTGPKTLREQEQELDSVKKDNFNLQLENHFLKERLGQMAPDHIEAALKENVKLKLEILNLSKETKKIKKLLLQQDRDLNDVQREREGASGTKGELKELERLYKEEKDRRRTAEKELATRGPGAGGPDAEKMRAQMEDVEAPENVWRRRCEQLEEEVEHLKGGLEDLEQDLAAEQERADRAEDGAVGPEGSSERDERRRARMQALEEDNVRLVEELEAMRRERGSSVADELEDRLNEMQDRLAAAQLDLDKRDQEIDELNAELEARLRDHEKEIGQVAAEWRDEVLEARGQVDELKDHDIKELRETLLDREEEVGAVTEQVHALEAAQAETHDRLEDTLKNIERDNAEKEADLIAANREVEELGQRVYELEELADELKAREADLNADLRSADEAFESSKTHYESLVAALKDARRKIQSDLDELHAQHKADTERLRLEIQDRETHLTRTKREVEDARERVAMRDRDLVKVQNALKALENERRKLGDEATSDKFGLELEMERLRRDLDGAEGDLEEAREALAKRDMEYSAMLDRQRELQDTLSAERQARLNMSDKLDEAMKSSKRYEREVTLLRERIEELEPLLTETQHDRFTLQKQNEQQRQERSELLLRVFKDVNRFLGTEDHTTPASFDAFRSTLLTRLRSMNGVRTDFEKRVKETEASVDQRMAVLKRQLEQKWRALDTFEASVKKLELTRMQWRSKYALKDGELEAAKTRINDLALQLSSERAGSSSTSNSTSSHLRSLTERAESAEKRAKASQNQLALLEAKVAEMQQRAGQAENKWEARVKEYENRLRIAGEKIKTEKQGGKERAMQLENQIKELERQVDGAKRRNARAEGVVATAAHLMPRSASGSSSRGKDSL